MIRKLDELIMAGVYARPLQMARSSLRWSGVSIQGGTITIATMSKHPDGYAVDQGRSKQFALAERDQASARALQSALYGFLQRSFIPRVFLRTGSGNAAYRGKPESHICEGILYGFAGADVRQVAAQSLNAWMRERGYDFDSGGGDRSWHLARATAMYAAEQEQPLLVGNRDRARASSP